MFDGRDGASRPLGTFTRRELLGLTLNSTSNHLRLEFDSDGADTAPGFQLSYSSEYPGTPLLISSGHTGAQRRAVSESFDPKGRGTGN